MKMSKSNPPALVRLSEGLAVTDAAPGVQRLLWFTFGQNNSGGSFVVDDNVCEVVCIQAVCAADAVAKAETFCDNSDSCECCGDRWSFYVEDSDGCAVPSVWGEPIETTAPTRFRRKAKLHYIDGMIETVEFGKARPLTLAT
jgi:hypothetical protein